jgi:ATP-binding cassette subfamily C protein/ATP-binding cassette subfamily C protein CydC/ATP-binding cassette subfamily C protein CydCD
MISLLRMVGFRRLVAAVLAAVLADAAGIALVGTATWLLVRAAQRPDLAALSLGIATVRAAATIRGFARYGERLISHDAALGALARLRGRVYGTLAGRSPVNVSALRAGGVLGSVVHDADAVQDLVVRCVIPAAGAVLVAVTSVVAAWLVLPAVVPVLATGLVVALVPIPALAVLATRRSDRLVAADRADLTSRVVDLLRGGAEVAVAGGTVRAEVDRAADRLTRRQRKAPALGATSAVLFVAGITAVAVLAVGAPRAVVQAVVFTLLTLAAFDSCVPLPTAARHLARIAGSVGRLDGLLGPTPPAGERPDVHTGRELVLRQVNIRYAASDDPALDSLDLRVPPGHRVAVVGASGAGKSTLLSAIARFVTPAGGRITLGGIDLDAWPEEQLRRTVGGVLADAHVFHDTIAANLRIGRPDATDAELVAVARRVRLLDWIESLPNRWRTVLGEDAALSSGGQRGRLLLARALLADPPVLLLDEPTEGLDAATADAVLADLLSATEGRSVVLVTHRLAGLAAMDEVVVLDGGRVRQRGAHARLLDEPGPYRELWRVHELVG